MIKMTLRWGLTCLGFGILACEAEPEQLQLSSTQAALTAAENSDRALQGVLDAADFLAGATSLRTTLNAMGGRSETCSTPLAAPCEVGTICPEPEPECTRNELSEEDLEVERQELRENFAELVEDLRTRILIPENLESETDTSATYRLGPDVLCGESVASAPVGGAEVATADMDCIEQANRLQMRLRLTSVNEGDIDVTVLVGAEQNTPVSLQLYHDSIGVRLDLGEALATARELEEDLGAIRHLAGLLELRLVENQARDYSLELNVLSALAVEVEDAGETVSASLGATSPAFNLRVDGNARSLSAGVDLGALSVAGPLRVFSDMFDGDDLVVAPTPYPGTSLDAAPLPAPLPPPIEEPSYTGVLEMFLAGLSGTLTYVADSDVLDITDIGLGDSTSTIKHDGNTLYGLDINALTGRRVNLTVAPLAEGGARVEVSPSFDLRLALAYQHIADQFENMEEYLLDNTIRVLFDGDAPALDVLDDTLRVASGHLNLSSTSPASNIDASAGMCLGEVDTTAAEAEAEAEAAGPFSSIGAGVCQ